MFGQSRREDISAGMAQSAMLQGIATDEVAVMACRTLAAANVAQSFLRANGIDASIPFVYIAYPSLGWVEGHHVQVAAVDEARARELLATLDRNDLAMMD